MNKKKIISTILACAMLPFGGLISASAQDTKPTYVQLNPADASPLTTVSSKAGVLHFAGGRTD